MRIPIFLHALRSRLKVSRFVYNTNPIARPNSLNLLLKRLYFFGAIKFFFALLCLASFVLGPLLLPIRLIDPKKGPLIVRRIISKGVQLYLHLLNKAGLHELLVQPQKDRHGVLFISNHASLLDALYYMALFPEICAIIKKDLFYLSPFSLISYCAGYIANNSKENTVDKVISVLKNGENVFIFPEGTRTKESKRIHLKRGASMIALRSGAPMYFGQISHSEEILGKETPIFYSPKNRIVAKISFTEIPVEMLRVDKDETPWIASRRISKLLEDYINSTFNHKT